MVLLSSVGVLLIGGAVVFDRSTVDVPVMAPHPAEPEPSWAARLSMAEAEKVEALARDAASPEDPPEWDATREAELAALRRLAGQTAGPRAKR